jgi:flagellar protein FlaG
MVMDMSVKLNLSYPPAAPRTDTVPAPSSPENAKAAPVALVPAVGEPKREDVEQAVSDIRDFVRSSQRNLDFSIDDSTGRVVVKVIETDTGDVIRQIPSENLLKLAQSLSDASSVLFDAKI